MKSYPFVWIALDVVSGLGASYLIAGNAVLTISVLSAIAGGNMPDVLHAFWSFMGKKRQKHAPKTVRRFFTFHESFQRETDSVPRGLVSQIILGGLAILITRILI